MPNGVDYAAYVRPWPEPADLAAISHPRIGYVGVIKKQLDLELLYALAERHRPWSFVLVGPQKHHDDIGALIRKLAGLPNVHFLGEKPVSALPSYTQHMDVCMLCYKVDDYTKFIYPLKLHESLATGLPCVGAPIRTLQEFPEVLDLADTRGGMVGGAGGSAQSARALGGASRGPARSGAPARLGPARPHDRRGDRRPARPLLPAARRAGPARLVSVVRPGVSRAHG